MSALTASILGGMICGITMVVGGILLLYKGAIKLEVASKDPALTVDLFKSQFSLTTRVPALGLFVIGLLFVGGTLWVARDTDVQRIPVSGEIENVDEPLTVTAYTQWSVNASRKEVSDVLRPSFDVLWIRVQAPGFQQVEKAFPKESRSGEIKLGKVRLERVVPKIHPKEANIATVDFSAPPFDPTGGNFRGQ